MKISEGTAALVALEDAAPDVLFESIPGTTDPLWPLFRWPAARATQEIELGTFSVRSPLTRTQALQRFARRLTPNPLASSRIREQSDLLFMVNGGTFTQEVGGRRNWLVQDFAESQADRSLVLQDRELWPSMPMVERPTFERTRTFADAFGRVGLAVRRHPLSDDAAAKVRQIVAATLDRLDFPIDEPRRESVADYAVARVAQVRHFEPEYARLLDRVQPRLVVIQTAVYGTRHTLIPLLKRRGITVAEPQHGWIGPYHSAYNFGAAMSRPELNAMLPDALLTFGSFWSDGIRFPNELVPIGKPHLEGMAAHPQTRDEVLVVSSVTARQEITEFTRALRDSLPGSWRVRFRPHPQERDRVADLYPGLAAVSGVEFDQTPDVMVSLATARGVFGLASTVLYEALAFPGTVYVIDSPLADFSSTEEVFGPRVSVADVPDVVGRLLSGTLSAPPAAIGSVWAPNSAQRFRDYVDRVAG